VNLAFHATSQLSVAQRALIGGIAAVVQLILGVFIGGRVGDTSSPSLLPSWLLSKLGTPVPTNAQLVVTLEDVVGATIKQIAARHPEAADVTADEVSKEILGAVKKPQPAQPGSSEPVK
jgi:hypothetical protein